MPPVIVWTVGAIGTAIVTKLIRREWRRVNADLDRVRREPVAEAAREALPKLRRDPASGVYRP